MLGTCHAAGVVAALQSGNAAVAEARSCGKAFHTCVVIFHTTVLPRLSALSASPGKWGNLFRPAPAAARGGREEVF